MPKGTEVIITQSLGGTYTLLVTSLGGLFRLSGKDADAIGQKAETPPESTPQAENEGVVSPDTLEKEVWAQLKTCFDPEIPVNIVDLWTHLQHANFTAGQRRKQGGRVDDLDSSRLRHGEFDRPGR
jgi:hypothetical protein